MENRSHALMAGLFTLFLGAAAVLSLWWFGGKREAMNDYVVVTTKTITGLNLQAQVRYRGVRVGKVMRIELDPKDVARTLIHIGVESTIPITRGVTAKLGYQGVTGLAHIQLEESGRDPTPLEGEGGELPRIAMQDSFVQEMTDVGGEALRSARDLLANVNLMFNAENRQSFTRTLANIEATTGEAKSALAELRQAFSADNVRALNAILARAEQSSAQMTPLLGEARGLIAQLHAVSAKLDLALSDPVSGPGVLLPRVNELSNELATSSRQLNRVLQMLEESPQSLIFGRPNAAPGPGEPGFSAPGGRP